MNAMFEKLMRHYISDDQMQFHIEFHALSLDDKASFLDYVKTRGQNWAESVPSMMATYFRMVSFANLLFDEDEENVTVH